VKPGRISFPLTKAVAFSARSVRNRMGRTLVVLMGVASAVAFLTVLFSLDHIMANVYRKTGATAEGVEALRRWWVVVALLISVIGITNAILMSVTERIKEIGTFRCLGAMSRHIIVIFLFEAMFLGLAGGLVGGVLGLTFTYSYAILEYTWSMVGDALTLATVAKQLGLAVGLSMGLCVVSAIYPVYFAARLEPADAMRYEV
jgi:predicted lysophospholipase L1 biosynthesis ABC-type transport system permease subunit